MTDRLGKVEKAIANLGYTLGKLPKKQVTDLLLQIANSDQTTAKEKKNARTQKKL